VIRGRREELRALPAERCCQVRGVSRSAYYTLAAEPSPARAGLDEAVQEAADGRTSYGYRRIAAHLRRKGLERATDKRVRLAMARLGLCRRPKRRWARTTVSGKGEAAPNLAAGLRPEGPRRLLVTDLTYVALPQGFGYVCVVLDAFSRRALGWAASCSLDAGLPVAALRPWSGTTPWSPGGCTTPTGGASTRAPSTGGSSWTTAVR